MAGSQPAPDPSEIGRRLGVVRRRRGLSQKVIADRAGISASYLSMLENGVRSFERRGLLEDLAEALACSVTDLTGQPYLPGDRASAAAMATLPAISLALYDATLEDVPDEQARPLGQLVQAVAVANEHAANSRYAQAGHGLGHLLTELHIHAVLGDEESQRAALAALAEACIVASGTARSLGHPELAIAAARRGEDAAGKLGDPAISGFAAMTSTSALSRLGARHRAEAVASDSLRRAEEAPNPGQDRLEAMGMLHLASAQMAAKSQRASDASSHLRAATELAARTGERNTLQFSFGPANVRAWSLSVAVELGDGPRAAETILATDGYDDDLPSADRRGALHFDLARGLSQAGGSRDREALQHLDVADRTAPQRIRHDPIGRELVQELERRHRKRNGIWELQSLKNRMGIQ